MIKNLQQLKDTANILDIVDKFIPLKKAGANYSANCPFHNEKSASFIVSPAKNIFTCFGCGKSGDSIAFIKEYKRLDFVEACEEVAELMGFTLEYEKGKQASNTKNLFCVLEKANELFSQSLFHADNAKILAYLHNRGLDDEMLKKYDFGFVSLRALNELKSLFSQKELEESGLLRSGKCSFYLRISIAVRDSSHKLRGFSSRTHPYGDFKTAPKYLNSHENAIFKKSLILYGASLAKSHIKQANAIIVCEGFMDCIAFHKFGYKHAVCTIGTAFNKAHLAHIYRLAHENVEIIFSFDNDSAGINANLRALRLCYENHFYNASVVFLDSQAKDMGEFLKEEQKPKMTKMHGFKYFVKMSLSLATSAQEKDRAYMECLKVISHATPFVREELQKIANTLLPKTGDVSKAFIENPPFAKAQYEASVQDKGVGFTHGRGGALQNAILKTMLENDEFYTIAQGFLSASDFVRPQDFTHALTRNIKELFFLKNTPILPENEWSISLEAFKKQGLERGLHHALEKNDFKLAELIREELKKSKSLGF